MNIFWVAAICCPTSGGGDKNSGHDFLLGLGIAMCIVLVAVVVITLYEWIKTRRASHDL